MKLLLVNPFFKGAIKIPSLGLGYIATYVRDRTGCEVEVVEQVSSGLSEEELFDKIGEADVLGLVCYTESRFEVFEFARKVKAANSSCTIIVGGAHVQTLDMLVLRHCPFIDIVVRREGEEPVAEIMEGRQLREIAGITWRDGREIVRNPDRPVMKDIDSLYLDYSLIAGQIEGWKDFEIPLELQRLKALPIIASRGCPFKCRFCAANSYWGTIYRYLSSEELVRRVEYFAREHGIGYFRFYDALFTGNEQRMLRFCDLIEEKRLKISFRVDVRVGTSERVLRRLREVGCDVLGFGIESGSDRILKRMNKGVTRSQVEETITVSKRLGYWLVGFFMVSLPDETEDDVMATFELLRHFDEADVQFFKVHPNTAFYDELVQKGEISDETWFDPAQGAELFYCRERFPSAKMGFSQVQAILSYAYNHLLVCNWRKALDRYGTGRGAALLAMAMIANTLLRSSMGRRIHGNVKNMRLVQSLYGWLKQ